MIKEEKEKMESLSSKLNEAYKRGNLRKRHLSRNVRDDVTRAVLSVFIPMIREREEEIARLREELSCRSN
jgi:transcriptional regulator with AAA-type ATPase domain